MTNHSWFRVDRDGLRRTRSENPSSLLLEMAQNALDTEATNITISLTPTGPRHRQTLVVEDDDPTGYVDLSHTYTLFAPSTKATDATKAGFMNIGEKQVLAWAESGSVESVSGSVEFRPDGTMKEWPRRKRATGSLHTFVLKITQAQADAMLTAVRRVIVAEGRTLTVNGEVVKPKPVLDTTRATLPIYVADDPANPEMRKVRRVTDITLHAPESDSAWLFNIGLPVQPLDTPWSVNVVNGRLEVDTKRNQVPERVLALILTAVASLKRDEIVAADVDTWARDVINQRDVPVETAQKLLEARYGPDALVAGADHAANADAAAEGRTLIGSRALTPVARENLHRVQEAAPDAFRTTNAIYGEGTMVAPGEDVPPSQWTRAEQRVVTYAKLMHLHLFNAPVTVTIFDSTNTGYQASYTDGHLTINRSGFQDWTDDAKVIELLVHEFAHRHGEEANIHGRPWGERCARIAGRMVVWGVRP
jgi:hypothetical protein